MLDTNLTRRTHENNLSEMPLQAGELLSSMSRISEIAAQGENISAERSEGRQAAHQGCCIIGPVSTVIYNSLSQWMTIAELAKALSRTRTQTRDRVHWLMRHGLLEAQDNETGKQYRRIV